MKKRSGLRLPLGSNFHRAHGRGVARLHVTVHVVEKILVRFAIYRIPSSHGYAASFTIRELGSHAA